MTRFANKMLLAVLLGAVATPAFAQSSDPAGGATTDTTVNRDNNDHQFPWGLLGLLGLAGLAGRKRDTNVRTDDRMHADATRR